MIDWLLPATDRTAVGQAVAVSAVGVLAMVLLRRHREGRVLAAGLTLMLLAGMGLRALH